MINGCFDTASRLHRTVCTEDWFITSQQEYDWASESFWIYKNSRLRASWSKYCRHLLSVMNYHKHILMTRLDILLVLPADIECACYLAQNSGNYEPYSFLRLASKHNWSARASRCSWSAVPRCLHLWLYFIIQHVTLTVDYGDVRAAPEEVGLSTARAPLCSIPEELQDTVFTLKVLGQSDVCVLQTGEEGGGVKWEINKEYSLMLVILVYLGICFGGAGGKCALDGGSGAFLSCNTSIHQCLLVGKGFLYGD